MTETKTEAPKRRWWRRRRFWAGVVIGACVVLTGGSAERAFHAVWTHHPFEAVMWGAAALSLALVAWMLNQTEQMLAVLDLQQRVIAEQKQIIETQQQTLEGHLPLAFKSIFHGPDGPQETDHEYFIKRGDKPN